MRCNDADRGVQRSARLRSLGVHWIWKIGAGEPALAAPAARRCRAALTLTSPNAPNASFFLGNHGHLIMVLHIINRTVLHRTAP